MKFVTPPKHPLLNVCIYGPPKTGKSAGAGTAPGKILYANVDTTNATRFVHRRNPGNVFEPEVAEFNKDRPVFFAWMVEIMKAAQNGEFDSVVCDPLSELYRRFLEDITRRNINASLQQRLEVSVQIERFCRALVAAPVNAIFVCHELEIEGTDDVPGKSLPYTGTSKTTLPQKLLGMVDIVAYTGVTTDDEGKDEYVAQLVPGKGRSGGDRFACLGKVREINIAQWAKEIYEFEESASANVGTVVEPEPEPQTPPRDIVAEVAAKKAAGKEKAA